MIVTLPKGHGLDEQQVARLMDALACFYAHAVSHRYDTKLGAFGECNNASDGFLHALERHGVVDAKIEHYDLMEDQPSGSVPEHMVQRDRARYPYYVENDVCDWHWSVRVGNVIVDWTARQFMADAPFPALWLDDERHEALDQRVDATRESFAP